MVNVLFSGQSVLPPGQVKEFLRLFIQHNKRPPPQRKNPWTCSLPETWGEGMGGSGCGRTVSGDCGHAPNSVIPHVTYVIMDGNSD